MKNQKYTYLLFSFVIATTLLASCAATYKNQVKYIGKEVTDENRSKFVIGKTTIDEVIASVGAPSTDNFNSTGERTITYFFSKYETKQREANALEILNRISYPEEILHQQTKTYTFLFDDKGIFRSFNQFSVNVK